MLPLFTRYPHLAGRCPYRPIGDWPTPVEEFPELGKLLGVGHLFVKRDDISGRPYGSNKVRKLEFLLAAALEKGAKALLTFGRAGSNHALATAIYGRAAGLDTIALLLPQPNAGYVRHNLLWSLSAGAELHQESNVLLLGVAAVYHFLRHTLRDRRLPVMIAPGGSSPLGTIGYVNAALELQTQIAGGLLPEPDLIYVTAATMGTAAGLLLGLRLAGLQSRVVAVRVTEEAYASEKGMVRLAGRTNHYLHRLDKTIPRLTFGRGDFDLCHDFYGGEYARFTPECISAVTLMKEMCDLRLEGTYTGKTFAALENDARRGALTDKVVVFWHTANSQPAPAALAAADYHQLPRSFHPYFERPVQELDNEQ